MFNFSRLIDWRFIFNPNLGPLQSKLLWFLVALLIALIFLAIFSYFLKIRAAKNKNWPFKKMWHKIFNWGLWSGLAGALLLFFRQQSVYFLALPLFFYLWFISVLASAIFIIIWAQTKMVKEIKNLKEEEQKKKYLP